MADQTHYVCPECEGVSDAPGSCSTDDCGREGENLKECHCDDDLHDEVVDDGEDFEDDEEDFDDDDEDY